MSPNSVLTKTVVHKLEIDDRELLAEIICVSEYKEVRIRLRVQIRVLIRLETHSYQHHRRLKLS